MKAKQVLVEKIKEMHFDAGHYLKSLPPCDELHGHTYVLRDLEITGALDGNVIVDFKKIKEILKDYDHGLLVPDNDASYWEKIVRSSTPFKLSKVVPIEG